MLNRLLPVLALCTLLNAQNFTPSNNISPASFRSQALGGAVFDDLDLVYDPIDLRFVKGIRFYTNLSNLTSSEEQLFNDRSDNEFLLGGSWKNRTIFDWWTSALIRFRNNETDNPLFIDQDLNGIPDIGGEGEFRNIYSAFLDTNGDGLADIRRFVDQRKISRNEAGGHAFILNNAIGVGEGSTLGIRYIRAVNDNNLNTSGGFYGNGSSQLIGVFPGDPSFDLEFTVTDLATNNLLFQQDEEGDFLNSGSSTSNNIHFSFMTPFNMTGLERVELRLDAGFISEKQEMDMRDTYLGQTAAFNSQIPDFTDSFSESSNVRDFFNYDGSGVELGGSLHKVFTRGKERRNDGFFRFSLSWQRLVLDYTSLAQNNVSFNDIQFDGLDTLGLDFQNLSNNQTRRDDTGEAVYNRLMGQFRINSPLGKKVYAGAAVRLNITDFDQTSEFSEESNNIRTFRLQDNTTSNDFTSTTTETLSGISRFEQRITTLSVPVGIEYAFTKNEKWSLRFGSFFQYQKISGEVAETPEESTPRTTITEFEDGNITSQVFDSELQTTLEKNNDVNSSSSFFYGLGYEPTEHLQLDLLGFLGTGDQLEVIDSEFYRSLRLSFTIKL